MKKVLLFVFLLIPFIYGLIELFFLENVQDPIKYIYTITGATATVILFFSVSISLVTKWINLIKYRRMIGLFAFFYAFLHFLNFYILDAELNVTFVIKETFDKPFIYLGMISFIILVLMAVTSTKKLFRKYNKYHKAVYLALGLVVIHFIMAQKSLTILQLIYIIIIMLIAYCKLLQQIINKSDFKLINC